MRRLFLAEARVFALLFLTLSFLAAPLVSGAPARAIRPSQAVLAPCGVVDAFAFPFPEIDVSRSDFGIYRPRWGGLHTGLDVAFWRHGEPVMAAARGRVTYSDIEGWDTEKGVVVLQHTFPDGTLINTLYGHMEELNGYRFPPMDSCVELGDVVGAVGDPSLSAPHLHFEVRTRYRHEGGPGYTATNPLELGWLHPIDFTYLARLWVHPAYRGHVSLTERPSVPPVLLPSGQYVVAHSRYLEGISVSGASLWRFDTVGSVIDLFALPDGRALALTSENQALIVNNGAVSGLWSLAGRVASGALLSDDRLVVVLDRDTVAAYALDGAPLWNVGPLPGRLVQWAQSGDRFAFTGADGELRIIDREGRVLLDTRLAPAPLVFGGLGGSFVVLQGETLLALDSALALAPVVSLPRAVTAGAHAVTAADGAVYLYPGEGRSLYAVDPSGDLRWIGFLPGEELRAPRLGVGGGALVHVLTAGGHLLSFDARDGRLLAEFSLYPGGRDGGGASARWLHVQPDETVRFGAGFLTIAELDGRALLGG